MGRESSINRGHQGLEITRPVVAIIIDEERRRSIHSAAHTACKVSAYTFLESSFIQRLTQSFRIQSQLRSQFKIQIEAQSILVRKEQVVHFPELALACRKLRSLRGSLCVEVNLRQRKIPKDKIGRAHV